MAENSLIGIFFGFFLLLMIAEVTGKHEPKTPQFCHEWYEGASRAKVCVKGEIEFIYNSSGVSPESVQSVLDSLKQSFDL